MTEKPQDPTFQLSDENAARLLRSLLHKEGSWVDWGKACQQLQKAGYQPQTIFEQTGFQGSQQNLIIVAAQVYETLLQAGVSEEILDYFRGPRSDVLYELRILTQEQRSLAAEFAFEKKLEADTAKEVAKNFQEFCRFSQIPPGFTNHPGDAVAYQYWKRAKQKKDLAERARFIAQGLKFAYSQSARDAIEQLLQDFSATAPQAAPLMPVHRLENEEELSRIVPIVGRLPLTRQDLAKIPLLTVEEPFQLVRITQPVALVPLPGWQSIFKAEDPVVILSPSDHLPVPLPGKVEEVMVVVDRASQIWDINSYFLVERDGELSIGWFEESPSLPLLGRVILVLRAKRILDENNLKEPWQMDD